MPRKPSFFEDYTMGQEAAKDTKRNSTLNRPMNALGSAAAKAKTTRANSRGSQASQRGSGAAARRTMPSGYSYRVIKHGKNIKFK